MLQLLLKEYTRLAQKYNHNHNDTSKSVFKGPGQLSMSLFTCFDARGDLSEFVAPSAILRIVSFLGEVVMSFASADVRLICAVFICDFIFRRRAEVRRLPVAP